MVCSHKKIVFPHNDPKNKTYCVVKGFVKHFGHWMYFHQRQQSYKKQDQIDPQTHVGKLIPDQIILQINEIQHIVNRLDRGRRRRHRRPG